MCRRPGYIGTGPAGHGASLAVDAAELGALRLDQEHKSFHLAHAVIQAEWGHAFGRALRPRGDGRWWSWVRVSNWTKWIDTRADSRAEELPLHMRRRMRADAEKAMLLWVCVSAASRRLDAVLDLRVPQAVICHVVSCPPGDPLKFRNAAKPAKLGLETGTGSDKLRAMLWSADLAPKRGLPHPAVCDRPTCP